MLTLKNVSVSVDQKTILNSISYSFKKDTVYVIMGPNGSGKSTLAYTLMAHPGYTLSDSSRITLNRTDITQEDAVARANHGIFLSFQSPLALTGVSIYQLLHVALSGKADPLSVRQKIKKYAQELKIPEELLSRPLNEGASGGERKKLEVLQAAVLDRPIQIYDEVDTGVDVDALATIATFLDTHRSGKTYIVITHYNRILRYLNPDNVVILVEGKIAREGGVELAHQVEQGGYSFLSGDS